MADNITYLANMLDNSEGKYDIFFEVVQCIKNEIEAINLK